VTRVLLVDDHGVVRLGLRTLLSAHGDMDVVGEASDGREALTFIESNPVDVVVLDLTMPGMDGQTTTKEIARRFPSTRVLILTMHDEEDYLLPLLESGASGYIVKDSASADLVEAIRATAAGRVFVRETAAELLASGWTRRASQAPARAAFETLSDREREVFRLMAQGYSSTQIGNRLFISAKTVDTYRRRINDKMGFTERAQYIRLALDLGLLVLTARRHDGRNAGQLGGRWRSGGASLSTTLLRPAVRPSQYASRDLSIRTTQISSTAPSVDVITAPRMPGKCRPTRPSDILPTIPPTMPRHRSIRMP
jgi:DNA-binding NarL/FixJ family response regulator